MKLFIDPVENLRAGQHDLTDVFVQYADLQRSGDFVNGHGLSCRSDILNVSNVSYR
jgi:hypothetical protein